MNYWKNQTVSARIRANSMLDKVMTPEQAQALNTHLQAIGQILYDDSDPTTLKTLEGIEMTLRQQIQTHVSPKLGSFLSKRLQERKQANSEP
jgi:hypothetical protein